MTFENPIYSATSLIISRLSLINYGNLTMDDASAPEHQWQSVCFHTPNLFVSVWEKKKNYKCQQQCFYSRQKPPFMTDIITLSQNIYIKWTFEWLSHWLCSSSWSHILITIQYIWVTDHSSLRCHLLYMTRVTLADYNRCCRTQGKNLSCYAVIHWQRKKYW